MNFAIYSALVFLASLLIVFRLKERTIYLVFLAAFTQNFVLAYLYTNGLAGRDLCRSLILFKEFLLLELFVYSVVPLSRHLQGRWPRPLLILFGFSAYCIVRFALGALFFGDLTADGVRKLRMVCFPAEILTVALAFTWLHPELSRKFIRQMTYFLAILAVVGIILFLFPAKDFWKQHVDIASYMLDVKVEDASTVNEEEGVLGTAAGREAFQFLSSFRAMGTFADPISFGFSMAMPILLLTFYYEKGRLNALMLAASGAAMFFTFTRSSWILVTIAFIYLWIQKRRFALMLAMIVLGTTVLLTWAPLREFAASEYSDVSWTNPGGAHAEGIVWFYQRAFTDLGNILGKGMDDSVQAIPENGYAFLLEHFGFVAYASFLWFCFSLLSYLKKRSAAADPLLLVAQAVPVGVLIVMHTSQYPFGFNTFLFIWFVVGVSLGLALKEEERPQEAHLVPSSPLAELGGMAEELT